MQKIKRKHAPSTRELDPSPRSRSRPRTRASVALPPRPFFYIYILCLCLSLSVFFSLLSFLWGKIQVPKKKKKWNSGLPDKRTKKTKKKFWLRNLFEWLRMDSRAVVEGPLGPKKKSRSLSLSLQTEIFHATKSFLFTAKRFATRSLARIHAR